MSIHLHLLFHTYTALPTCLFSVTLQSVSFFSQLWFPFPSIIFLHFESEWSPFGLSVNKFFFLKHSHCFALTETYVYIICNIHSKSSHFLPFFFLKMSLLDAHFTRTFFFIKQCLVILVTRLVICVVFVLHNNTLQNYSSWRICHFIKFIYCK